MGVTVNITIGSDAILTGERPFPRTHPCGTNHFGMLPEGLGDEELRPADLEGCILWGDAAEPMTTWVACHFLFQDKAFRVGQMLVKSPVPPFPKVKDHKGMDVRASASGAKAGWGVAQAPDKIVSNAVPMLELNPPQQQMMDESVASVTSSPPPSGLVIADGVMINYLIIPLLYPQKMTPDILRWERKIGYEFIPAMWREYDGADYCTAFQRTCPNYPASFKSRMSPIMRQPVCVVKRLHHREMRVLKNYIGQEYAPALGTTRRDIYVQFKTEMGQHMGKQDFMGGEFPNATYVSFYGVNILRFVTNVGNTRTLIEQCGLLPWFYRMMDLIPPSKCLKMDYFGPAMTGWKGGWLLDPPQFEPVRIGGRGGIASASSDAATNS